ncbi:hypothetical protein ACTPEM_24790, partial [Clostridioides difficile]
TEKIKKYFCIVLSLILLLFFDVIIYSPLAIKHIPLIYIVQFLPKQCVDPEDACDVAEYVEVYFEKGVPKKVNGEELSPVALIHKL